MVSTALIATGLYTPLIYLAGLSLHFYWARHSSVQYHQLQFFEKCISFSLIKGYEAEKTQGRDSSMWLQVYIGLAWTLGCAVVGLLIVREPSECKIGRQYLCQVSSIHYQV